MERVTASKYNTTRIWFLIIMGVVACLVFMSGFFILNASMSKPASMKLFLPKDGDTATLNRFDPAGRLTILLGGNDKIYFYEGELAPNGSNINQSSYSNIRKVILDKKSHTDEKIFAVVIKPAEGASYTNTVDILDEMTINHVKRYAMVDITPAENETINKK